MIRSWHNSILGVYVFIEIAIVIPALNEWTIERNDSEAQENVKYINNLAAVRKLKADHDSNQSFDTPYFLKAFNGPTVREIELTFMF